MLVSQSCMLIRGMCHCRPIAHLISWLIPTWPVVEVNRNTMYPDIQAEWDQGKAAHMLLYYLREHTALFCMPAISCLNNVSWVAMVTSACTCWQCMLLDCTAWGK